MTPRVRIFVSMATGRCWPAPFAEQPSVARTRPARGLGWTAEEDAALREFYPLGGTKLCTDKIPTRSRTSIQQRAHKLGVQRGRGKRLIDKPRVTPVAFTPVIRKAGRGPMSFDEQMAAVANGAGLVNVERIRRPDPTGTLGGVVGEIL